VGFSFLVEYSIVARCDTHDDLEQTDVLKHVRNRISHKKTAQKWKSGLWMVH
jgi:hypothetical protein